MPTIDQLSPATASSDGDAFMASQGGVVRRVTRAQITNGFQPAISINSGVVLGRSSTGAGFPEQISIGANLSLRDGTLSAAAPFVISSLPLGSLPTPNDLVGFSQRGSTVATSFSQFMSGLSGLSGIDVSGFTVTPNGSTSAVALSALAAGSLSKSGGTMGGALVLAGDPTLPLGAATKHYVDTQFGAAISVSGGTLTGPLILSASPNGQFEAATKQYVDTQVATSLPRAGGMLTGPLALPSDPSDDFHAATKRYVDGLGVSLEASGAKGDSVTDDSIVINAFLAGLQAGTRVQIPSGRFYYIGSGNLVIPTAITIEGASPFANPARNALFSGCGFLLNPSFRVDLHYAAQLRNLKVLRSGLLTSPAASDVTEAVATWSSEALNLTCSTTCSTGTSVLGFAVTTGVAVGMAVFGKYIPSGTTVIAVTSVSVTLSKAVVGNVVVGQGFRFGASIGVLIPANEGNNVLSDVQIVGFRTGILAMAGEFFASRVQADCITVLEATWAGDNAYLSEFHCVPYYGVALGNASNCWRRPGPAFYLHDQTDGWVLADFFALHWQTGFLLSNVGAVTLIRCGYEKIQDGWTGTTGFLWQGHAASCQCFDGYSNGATINMDMQHGGEVQISGMSTVGCTDGTGIAHYRLGSGSYGAIYNAMINEAGSSLPILVQPNVVRWKIVAPFIDNGTTSPWISIDPSSVAAVDLFNVRDTNGFSPAAVESHLHEKLWITTDPRVATTDGSPSASLAVEATSSGSGAAKNVAFLRAGSETGSIQTVPSSSLGGAGLVVATSQQNSNVVLMPSGGALIAAIPDGTATGGNPRGPGGVDLQMIRSLGAQVASGASSAIVGGANNTTAGGYCVAGGSSNFVSGTGGTAFGIGNQLTGQASAAPGGANGADRGRIGTLVWASDASAPVGARQISKQILGATTTDATPTRLTADSQAPGAGNTVNLQDGSIYSVRLSVAARHTQGTNAATWVLDGLLLYRGVGPSSVSLIGGGTNLTPTRFIGSGSTWSISVAADTVRGGLSISAVGATPTMINWTASVETTEAG